MKVNFGKFIREIELVILLSALTLIVTCLHASRS
jgi:hypothetical protein